MKRSHAYEGYARTYNIETSNSFKSDLQPKVTDPVIKNKLKTVKWITLSPFVLKVKRITTNSENLYFIPATFRMYFFSPFSSFNGEKLSYKYYSKRIATRDNGNVQSHDQAESKLNSTINTNSVAHKLTHD